MISIFETKILNWYFWILCSMKNFLLIILMRSQFESNMPKYQIFIFNIIDAISFNINGFAYKQWKWLEAIFFSTENVFMNILQKKIFIPFTNNLIWLFFYKYHQEWNIIERILLNVLYNDCIWRNCIEVITTLKHVNKRGNTAKYIHFLFCFNSMQKMHKTYENQWWKCRILSMCSMMVWYVIKNL